ncbi:MAG: geranyl transferase, partial [Gammaproteobacteria bacterium]
MSFEQSLQTCRDRIERILEDWLPDPGRDPHRLHEAMRYAVLGGGKRVRPLLVYLTGEALGVPAGRLD